MHSNTSSLLSQKNLERRCGHRIHHLAKDGWGILYLCFSWTLIPVLVGLVEGILLLAKSDEEFQRQHRD